MFLAGMPVNFHPFCAVFPEFCRKWRVAAMVPEVQKDARSLAAAQKLACRLVLAGLGDCAQRSRHFFTKKKEKNTRGFPNTWLATPRCWRRHLHHQFLSVLRLQPRWGALLNLEASGISRRRQL